MKYNLGEYKVCRRNRYCPTCKAFNSAAHAEGCTDEKVYISYTARLPKKTATKKVWDEFYDKFVNQTELIETLEEIEAKRKIRVDKIRAQYKHKK